MHSGVYKPRAQWALPSTLPTPTASRSKHPAVSPPVSGIEVSCHIYKMGFTDGSAFVGHIQVEHPQYIYFCDYPHCYRLFIIRSGLYKRTKQVHPKKQEKPDPDTKEFTVVCGLCFMEFSSEEACDAHDCLAKKSPKPSNKKEPKVDIDNG